MTTLLSDKNVVVISDVLGQRGGAYRATSLLCQALRALGANVTCFATYVESESQEDFQSRSIRIVRPLLRRGYRWDWPNRTLAWQARRYIENTRPCAVIVMGLTRLCGYLLESPVAVQLLVWELTNADPGNKFVDKTAARLLSRCRTVLSPALSIDQHIRATYQYEGPIERLPFWIEPGNRDYQQPPEKFSCDFLFLSRREDDKGLADLIRACELLQRWEYRPQVVIAGGGRSDAYEQLAEELGVRNLVRFVTLPSRSEAMEVLEKSRFVVLPSHHEGYPISLLEAAQRSVPVIATRVGAIPCMMGDGGACAYAAVRNPEDLAKVLRGCLSLSKDEYCRRRRDAFHRFCVLNAAGSNLSRILHISENTASVTGGT